jgi:sugar phosphate isomerase/epimerase
MGRILKRRKTMSIKPEEFDMPVASFNEHPMKLGLFTDGLADMPFERMLDEAVKMGIKVLEFGTGGYSCAPHLNMGKLLESANARKEFMNAIESRGLEICALNCSANAIGPGERWASHAPDVMNTFRLAELLGIKHIVAQSGLPAGSPTDTALNWVLHTYPPEMLDVLKYQWDVTIKFWSKAADLAKTCGVETIALEEHPMNMVFNYETLMHLRNAVGPIIGLNLDPSHMFFMGGDPILMARKLCEAKAVYHVHGKDTRINDHIKGTEYFELGPYNGPAAKRVWNYVAVGYGHDQLWWKEFFATLAAGDYHGPVCIEVEDPLMPNNLIAIQKSAKFLQETMLS